MQRDIFLDILLQQNYSLRAVIKSSLSLFRANNANANNLMSSKLIVFKPQLTDYLFLTIWPWLVLLPQQQLGAVKSRTHRDNKILRKSFLHFLRVMAYKASRLSTLQDVQDIWRPCTSQVDGMQK